MSLPVQWRVINATRVGASHLRLTPPKPNQDAIGSEPAGGTAEVCVLAVSDGHGSERSFRSDRGSRFAVEIALSEIGRLVRDVAGEGTVNARRDAAAIRDYATAKLPQDLVRAWRERVADDIREYPIDDELGGAAAEDEAAQRLLQQRRLLAYGATLLAVAVTPGFILYLQLGDGEIITVSDYGETTRPLVADARLMANETTSLCAEKAWNDFRPVVLQPIADRPPALILVTTDGYPNSFRTQADFDRVGPDLHRMMREEGIDPVASGLDGWLAEASELGSGDDMTVGLLCRLDAYGDRRAAAPAPPRPEEAPPADVAPGLPRGAWPWIRGLCLKPGLDD